MQTVTYTHSLAHTEVFLFFFSLHSCIFGHKLAGVIYWPLLADTKSTAQSRLGRLGRKNCRPLLLLYFRIARLQPLLAAQAEGGSSGAIPTRALGRRRPTSFAQAAAALSVISATKRLTGRRLALVSTC